MNRFFATILSCAVVLSACVKGAKDDETPVTPPPSGEISVPAGGESLTIYADEPEDIATLEFSSTEAWTISAQEEGGTRGSTITWVEFYVNGQQTTGGAAGEQKISIRLTPNDTSESRKATVIIRSGENTQEITLTQDSRTIEQAMNDGDYEPRPGEFDFEVLVPGGGGSYHTKIGYGDDNESIVQLAAIPAQWHAFKQWRVVSGGIAIDTEAPEIEFVMPEESVQIELEFEAAPSYPITAAADATMGSVTCTNNADNSAVAAMEGAEVTLKAVPEDGYQFSKWEVVKPTLEFSVSDLVNSTLRFVMPAEEVSVKAVFVKQFDITVTSSDTAMGTASASRAKAAAGDKITLTATPVDGFKLDKWTVVSGGVTVASDNTFTMPAAAVSVRADFGSTAEFNVLSAIPDPIIAAYCQKNFDSNKDGVLTRAEAEAATTINFIHSDFNNPITSLAGIEYFTKLTILSIPAIYVNCSTAGSVDLSKNTELLHLNLAGHRLTTLDLTNNTKLQSLDCNSNLLTSLDIDHLTQLEQLYCQRNPLTTLDVSVFPQLWDLNISETDIAGIDVSSLTKLTYFNCGVTKITSLNLSNNTKLQNLTCNQLEALTSLNVSNLPELLTLDCSFISNLGSLDLSNNPELRALNCEYCGLTSLDVADCAKLEYLNCSTNELTSLDVKNAFQLIQLICKENHLTTLDLRNNIWLGREPAPGDPLGNAVEHVALSQYSHSPQLIITISPEMQPMWEKVMGAQTNVTAFVQPKDDWVPDLGL